MNFWSKTCLIFTLIFSHVALCQQTSQSRRIIATRYDSTLRTSIIPDNIFETNALEIKLTYPVDTVAATKKFGFQIEWPSTYLDGLFVLTITKAQIYLRSKHNNPNPNHLFWFQNITPQQFQQIEILFRKEIAMFREEDSEYYLFQRFYFKGFEPEKRIPKNWTSKNSKDYKENWSKKKHQNLSEILSYLNKNLDADKYISIPSQEDLEQQNPVIISSFH